MELYYVIIFTAFINAFGWVMYIIDTLKWKTKPNKVTWWIWAAAPLIGSFAMYSSNWLTWNILPVFMAGFIPLLIFISSFINKNSYWELKKLDYICLILAILALILWQVTDNPLLAIVFWILADFLAAIPILIKTYNFPETENPFPFFAWLLANLSALLVIKEWNIEEWLFPVYLILICLLLILAYYWKRILWKLS